MKSFKIYNQITSHTVSDINYVLLMHDKEKSEITCEKLNINMSTYKYILKTYGGNKEKYK